MTYWYKLLVLAPCGLMVAWFLAKRLHLITFPFFLQMVLGVLWIYPWPKNQYETYAYLDKVTLQFLSFVALMWMIFILVGVSEIPRKHWLWVERGVAYFCALNSLFVFVQAFLGIAPFYRVGFLYNASINACSIAMCYPFAIKHYPRFHSGKPLGEDWICPILFWICPLIAVYLSGSSMGIGAMAVSCIGVLMAVEWNRSYLFKGAFLAGIGGAFLWMGYLLMGTHELFSDSQRFGMWRLAYDWWQTSYIVNPWLGTGLGSTQVFLPFIQQQNNFLVGEWFIWMHNDWFQVLFEQGYIGFITLLIPSVWILWQLRKNTLYFPALLSLAATATANWPMHQSVFALLATCVIVGAFRKAAEK